MEIARLAATGYTTHHLFSIDDAILAEVKVLGADKKPVYVIQLEKLR
jgi:hypothetical protein